MDLRDIKPDNLYFATLYFVAVASLYLWGYWGSFDLNILEYLSVADILKLSAYPVVYGFVFVAIGAALGELLKFLPERQGETHPRGRLASYFWRALGTLSIIAILVYWWAGPTAKWNTLPLVIGTALGQILKNQGFLEDVIPSARIRTIALYLASVLPFHAYGHGVLDADQILSGRKYQYTTASKLGTEPENPNSDQKVYKYLGHAGDRMFFLSEGNLTVLVYKLPDDLKLMYYPALINRRSVAQDLQQLFAIIF